MKVKNLIKKRKQKKNLKAKKNQEEKIKEYCRSFKEKNPNASDDAVLAYAFRTVYGSKGIEIMKRIKKDPLIYQNLQDDLQKIDEWIETGDEVKNSQKKEESEMVYRNLNDEDSPLWTKKDLEQLRKDEEANGLYVEDSFEDWLHNKLECDFEEVNEKELER